MPRTSEKLLGPLLEISTDALALMAHANQFGDHAQRQQNNKQIV